MGGKINEIDFTEDLYTALKDYFIAEVICSVTDVFVTFITGDKFKISVQKVD